MVENSKLQSCLKQSTDEILYDMMAIQFTDLVALTTFLKIPDNFENMADEEKIELLLGSLTMNQRDVIVHQDSEPISPIFHISGEINFKVNEEGVVYLLPYAERVLKFYLDTEELLEITSFIQDRYNKGTPTHIFDLLKYWGELVKSNSETSNFRRSRADLDLITLIAKLGEALQTERGIYQKLGVPAHITEQYLGLKIMLNWYIENGTDEELVSQARNALEILKTIENIPKNNYDLFPNTALAAPSIP